MTARPQDVALLPLPASSWQLLHDDAAGTEIAPPTPLWNADKMAAYARANVTAALASAQAREEELRADRDSWAQQASDRAADWYSEHQRAERLEEALRELFDDYKRLADSGDAGFWKLEDTYAGKKALAALSTNAATQTGERT